MPANHFDLRFFFLPERPLNSCALRVFRPRCFIVGMKRREARALGLATYDTGKPCGSGHLSPRYSVSGHCIACEREKSTSDARRAANKARYWKNVEERRRQCREAARRAYAAKKNSPEYRAKVIADKRARYLRAHPGSMRREEIAARAKANRERVAADKAARRAERQAKREAAAKARDATASDRRKAARARILATDPDYYNRARREWAARNRQKCTALKRQRRKARRETVRRSLLVAQGGRCAYCRSKLQPGEFHADHIMPRARGGADERRNLQLTCAPCNLRKGAKDPVAFAQELGRLV